MSSHQLFPFVMLLWAIYMSIRGANCQKERIKVIRYLLSINRMKVVKSQVFLMFDSFAGCFLVSCIAYLTIYAFSAPFFFSLLCAVALSLSFSITVRHGTPFIQYCLLNGSIDWGKYSIPFLLIFSAFRCSFFHYFNQFQLMGIAKIWCCYWLYWLPPMVGQEAKTECKQSLCSATNPHKCEHSHYTLIAHTKYYFWINVNGNDYWLY